MKARKTKKEGGKMKLDLFKEEREKAEVLECGLKVLKENNIGNRPTLKIWKPKAIKPYANYYFESDERLEEYLQKQINNFLESKKIKEERKIARKGTSEDLEKIKVGSIFHYSWGYDQTNVEFYQVIEKTARTVKIRELAQESIGEEGISSMAEYRKPIKDSFLEPRNEGDEQGEILTKKIQFSNGEPFLSFRFGWCSLWDGQKKYCSWYA